MFLLIMRGNSATFVNLMAVTPFNLLQQQAPARTPRGSHASLMQAMQPRDSHANLMPAMQPRDSHASLTRHQTVW